MIIIYGDDVYLSDVKLEHHHALDKGGKSQKKCD